MSIQAEAMMISLLHVRTAGLEGQTPCPRSPVSGRARIQEDSVVPGPCPVFNPSARLPSNYSLLSEYNVDLRHYYSEWNQQKHKHT